MNQEKIGKFILDCRKKKNMTQSELAEKLGVSDRTIGNWENGRNMPDLSLFKPLCDELGITINELLSGENIKKEKYQEKFEENIINTIDYSTRKINLSNNVIGYILLSFGILITLSAMTTINSDSSWGSIYSVIGCIISLIGVSRLIRKLSYPKRTFILFGYFIIYISALFLIDYVSTVTLKQIPRFCTFKYSNEYIYECENPFYNVFKINRDTANEYIIIDKKKEYNMDTVPIFPFNKDKSSIDNIIKYKNKYVGNNSNDSNLINSLPLSEYGYVFEIDSTDLGLIISYNTTDWYINEDFYLDRSLVYNSVSIFYLIDNIDYIKYNFSGKTYEINRSTIEDIYPNYKDIKDTKSFKKYVEDKMNDNGFVSSISKKLSLS